jgi:cysteine desulfurase/selenocysteine lyase
LGAALDYITGIGLTRISDYEHFLYMHGEEALRSVNGINLVGNAEGRASILPMCSITCRLKKLGQF